MDSNVYNYRHREPFKPGEYVWFQNRDSNAWFGPGIVVSHNGNVIWIRAGRDIRKVAEHNVQPYGSERNDPSDAHHSKNVEEKKT